MNQSTLFSSATVLLLNVWNAKSRGQNSEASKDIQRVEKVGNVLQTLEKRSVTGILAHHSNFG